MSQHNFVEIAPLISNMPTTAFSRGPVNVPPLRGDGKGGYKVNIVGNSGAGKSTVAAELAAMLNLPCIHLDRLYWQPGWREPSPEDFRSRVFAALDEDPRGWIVDGNYTRLLGSKVSDEATDVIWLDPPLILYFPRLVYRTFLRLFRLAPPCSTGCEERASEVFLSRESIIWWCLTHHAIVRKHEAERYHTDGVHVGGKRRRIGGWGRELTVWKQEVQETI
ncbi:AAA domain-containing protein [Ganoderma leucocontextum]|nr:AAA domain-containing protein [Ganoderma leucocontextum]